MKSLLLLLPLCTVALAHPVPESPLWLTYPGGDGPGKGRHIVLIAADQEYRSEQSLPLGSGFNYPKLGVVPKPVSAYR